MGDNVTLVSSAEESAKDVYGVLTKTGLLRPDNLPEPRHRFVTTGNPAEFAAIGSRFLGPVVSSVDQFAWIR
jgi:glutamate racemase